MSRTQERGGGGGELAAVLARSGMVRPLPGGFPCPGCYEYPAACVYAMELLGMRASPVVVHFWMDRPGGNVVRAWTRDAEDDPGLAEKRSDRTGAAWIVAALAPKGRAMLGTLHFENKKRGHDVGIMTFGNLVAVYDPDGGPERGLLAYIERTSGRTAVRGSPYVGIQTVASRGERGAGVPGNVAGLCSTWAVIACACMQYERVIDGWAIEYAMASASRRLGMTLGEVVGRASYAITTKWAAATGRELESVVCCEKKRTGSKR